MPTDSPDAVAAAFVSAINAQDLGGAVELWAVDAVFIPAAGDSLVGREAIRGALEGLTNLGAKIHVETSTTYVAGHTALRVGRLKLVAANGDSGSELTGDYITVYRREANGWRIAIDAPFGPPAHVADRWPAAEPAALRLRAARSDEQL